MAAELAKRAAEADARLKRLYEAIERGLADLDDPALKDRIAELNATRDQARVDAERASIALESAGQPITADALRRFAESARRHIRSPQGYRRDHLRALAQRVEVADGEVRIMGSKTNLLRTLAGPGVAASAGGVPSFVPKWRRGCPLTLIRRRPQRTAGHPETQGNPEHASTHVHACPEAA